MATGTGDGTDEEQRVDTADRSMPQGPDGIPVLGNAHQFLRDPLGFYETLAHDHAGDVATYRVFGERGYLLSNPADIERVLVSDNDDFVKGEVFEESLGTLAENGLVILEGEQWKRHREAFQPAFAMDRIQSYADTMSEFAARTAANWTDGERLAVDDEMRELTLDILAKTLFDIDVQDKKRAIDDASHAISDRLDMRRLSAYLPLWVPTPANRRCRQALDQFHDVVNELIDERQRGATDAEGSDRDDLLSLMLDAVGEDAAMSEAELRDEMITFLFAGHETTALGLSYAWFLLANDPDRQAKLHDEVDALDDDPGVADLPALEYTDRIVSETLRLYPPASSMLREPVQDVELGGYTIPEGSVVVVPQWIVQRDERWYDDPDQFRPERWTNEFEADLPDYAYFPFGGGPRHCIGMRFARMELKLAIATIARRWAFEPGTEPPLDLSVKLTLQPEHGIDVVPRRRTDI